MYSYLKNVLLLVALLVCNTIHGQNISGCVTDKEGIAIPSAVVLLHQSDSSIIEITTTDTLGQFTFGNSIEEGYILIQHLSYENQEISFKDSNHYNIKHITLVEKSNLLDDITISAQAHVVKVDGGKLIVNTSKIKERKAVSSAFDLLRYTPGVTVQGDAVKILGVKEPTIIIDGKKTQLSSIEIIEKLKAISADKVANIEIMYKAPAKYNVHGSLINIVTDKTQRESPVTAELSSTFEQEYFGYYIGSQDIEYIGEKLRAELMLGELGGGIFTGSTEDIEYSYNGNKTFISIDNNNPEDYLSGKIKFGLDFDFTDDIKLSSYYYAKKSIDQYKFRSQTNIVESNANDTILTEIFSRNNNDNDILNQNAYLSLDIYDLSLSVDYINYNQGKTANYFDKVLSTNTYQYHSTSSQLVDRFQFLSNYDFNINDNFSMDIGLNLTLSNSNTEIKYQLPDDDGIFKHDDSKFQLNIQKEQSISLFDESSISLLDSTLDINLGIEASWFVSKYEHNKIKKTLWNNFTVFPSLNIVWNLQHDNAFDFTFYTHRDYPSYYSTNTDTTQTNAIVSIVGNPELKPDMQYYTDLTYILNGLYSFSISGTYTNNQSISLNYIDSTSMKEIEQEVNLDYDYELSTMIYIPLSYGFWDASITSYLFYHRQMIEDFHGSSFNRSIYASCFEMNNSFSFFDNKLTCGIDFLYKSKDIHGVFNMNHGFGLNCSLRWKILDNLILSSEWKNITGTYNPNPSKMDFNSIKCKIVDKGKECSVFDISLLFRIGDFKPKQLKGGDTNRIGM